MAGVDVVLALRIAGDRRDLVGLDDQFGLKPPDCLSGLLRSPLIRIADCYKRCHGRLLLYKRL